MLSKIINKTCRKIEKIISKRKINPILTIWLNFRCLPFSQARRFPIYVYGRAKLYNTSCKIIIEAPVKAGMIKFNYPNIWGPSIMDFQSEFNCSGKIIFKGGRYFGTGSKICIKPNATVEIGDHFKIADCVNIGCANYIKIGNKCRITHRCQIFDTNYHYLVSMKNRTIRRKTQTVNIGNSCWICNSSTISPGTILPDYTIVGSNSLVNKDFSDIPSYSLIAGIPAKYLCNGFIRLENCRFEEQVDEYFKTHQDNIFRIPDMWDIANISKIL